MALRVWSVVIAPEEDLVCSKTQTFDDTVLLDVPAFLGPMLGELAAGRDPQGFLFRATAPQMLYSMKTACELLNLAPTLNWYQLRHGGASADVLGRRRAGSEIQARGRWKRPESMRRYAKAAQVQKVLTRLGADQRRFTGWALANLEPIMKRTLVVRFPITVEQAQP